MARPRNEESSGKSGAHYAWSNIHHGGKTEQRQASGNRMINVVLERDITPWGEKVSQADLGVTDEEWDALVASGSVRAYPPPEGADEYTSPNKAVMDSLVGPDGEVDLDKVMALQNMADIVTSPEAINPPAEEGKELPAGA